MCVYYHHHHLKSKTPKTASTLVPTLNVGSLGGSLGSSLSEERSRKEIAGKERRNHFVHCCVI